MGMTTLSDLNDEYGIKLKAATEYSLQTYVIKYLRAKNATPPFPDLTFFHVYNGRNEKEGFFLKQLGVLAGVCDLLLIAPNQPLMGIELKVGKNQQSEHQKNFAYKMNRCGHKTAVCRSVAEVRDCLIGWGLTCHNTRVIEPPRSELEQREAAFDMYRRTPPQKLD
jgi:hypothetical protein